MAETKAEASVGFPGDCPTNAFLLEGFGHIVYMVSTVPAGNGDTDASAIARLRNAERELRTQSPLVFLDLATNELFAFHRLIDFQRDGKNIYGKLAMVLRQNKCINSFKSALKVTDILKEEHTRLRGILLAAVFSAIKSSLVNEVDLLPLGMRSFLRSPAQNSAQIWDETSESVHKGWEIEMVDLQLLAHGQILVTNFTRKPEHFYALSDILDTKSADDKDLHLDAGILCLAPTGQMARYTDGQILTDVGQPLGLRNIDTAQSNQAYSALQQGRQKAWKGQFLAWCAEQGVPDDYLDCKYWIEIEILLSRGKETAGDEISNDDAENYVWNRVVWPAQLCFYTSTFEAKINENPAIPMEDPVAFVQDWLLRSEERARDADRRVSTNADYSAGHESQQTDAMEEENSFGSTPQMHNAFSAGLLPSQMMYPTPPDIPYTQATPGMSSVDGLGMTPADTSRPGPVAVDTQHDMNMLETIDTSGVGTGTYDEDLFEDLPTNRFSTAGAAEEPDWDFFEQQNADTSNGLSQRSDPVAVDTVSGNAEDMIMSTPPTESHDPMLSPKQPDKGSSHSTDFTTVSNAKEELSALDDANTPSKNVEEKAELGVAIDVPTEDPVSPKSGNQTQSIDAPPAVEIWKKPALPPGKGRRRSLYDSNEDLTIGETNDERYAANGAFWFEAVSREPSRMDADQDLEKNTKIVEDPLRKMQNRRTSSEGSVESDTSSFFEVEGMDIDEDEPGGPKPGWTEYDQKPSSSATGPTAEELEQMHSDNRALIILLRPTTLDHTWTLGSIDKVAPIPVSSASSEHSVMTAQVLVDQLAQTCLAGREELSLQHATSADLRSDSLKALESPYGRLEPCTLMALTKSKESTLQNDGTKRVENLDRRQVSLSRADKAILLAATALPLWEHLNLQPSGGRKDVQGFCLHPASPNLESSCGLFLERIGESYVNCNLGDHSIGQIAGTSNNGLMSWSDTDDSIPNLEQCCERLGTALARLPLTSDNIVIYMIMAPGLNSSPVLLVNAFCVLYEAYRRACNKQQLAELGLQLVPLDFVASADALVIHSSQEYRDLAIEVYNRFPPTQLDDRRAYCGSAIVIAESPKRRIRFDLSNPSATSSEIGSPCLHVSYSSSQNERWLVAAWTDEQGFRALTMCYPVKGPGNSKTRPRVEIISDIWEVSQDLMWKERRRWRLVVAKNGFYEPSEIHEWATVLSSHSSVSTCSLTLVSVDLDPSLAPRIPSTPAKPLQGATPQQAMPSFGTPVSTPQASSTSPEQHLTATPTPSALNAATPPEVAFDPNNEADVTVQDVTEESWSVILPFGLNQSREVLPARPALLSGFLLKRQGNRDEDGLARLGVSLIHASALSYAADADEAKRKAILVAREELLKDVLGQFRGLVTLAKTRAGSAHAVHDVVPWHVATAVKGARVLNKWL